ncbi:MAG: hypothetical protein HN929_11475 [Chloroflexi bacterium]|jgi:hypothetical protein|nr:hypothetical protein [Chloroflexota bacterium]
MSGKLKEIRALVEYLEGERQTNEDEDAKKISEYLMPYRGFWPDEGEEKKTILERGKKNINPIATLSLERAAGGLTVGMTPEGLPWKSLRVQDDQVMESLGVRAHLDYRMKLVDTMLQKGGFYPAIYLCNLELFTFGGLLLFQDRNLTTLSHFECCTFGTYCIALNSEGQLDTVVRRLKWSAGQLKIKYGIKKLSDKTKHILEHNPYTPVDIVHVVRPRAKYDDRKIDSLNMPYESFIYEDFPDSRNIQDEVKGVLSESGYHEMPYDYTAFSRVGTSDYGIGPGHQLLRLTMQLNETERLKLVALGKIVHPPVIKPSKFKYRLNVGAGQETAIDAIDGKGLGPLYEIPYQGYQYASQEIKDVMERIAAVAKADLFYDLPQEMRPKDMTATEYMERKRERMQQIAPVVSIYESDVLDTMLLRCHNILNRAGLFPDPPPALLEAGGMKIEYMSTVAKSLRQVGAEAARVVVADVRALAEMQVAANMPPTVLHKLNMPQVIDEIATGVGAPARIIRSDDEYEEILAEEKQKEEQAAKMQAEQMQAEQAAKLGNVRTEKTIAGEIMRSQA